VILNAETRRGGGNAEFYQSEKFKGNGQSSPSKRSYQSWEMGVLRVFSASPRLSALKTYVRTGGVGGKVEAVILNAEFNLSVFPPPLRASALKTYVRAAAWVDRMSRLEGSFGA